MGAELADAARELEFDLARAVRPAGGLILGVLVVGRGAQPLVHDADAQAGHQVGGLPGPLGQRLESPAGAGHEDLRVGPEPGPGAGHGPGDAPALAQARAGLERRVRAVGGELARHAPAEAGRPLAAAAVHLDLQAGRQGVDHRGADAVQAARRGVGAAAELAARVQPGHDQLDAGQPAPGLVVHRDAAAVVAYLGRAVGVQGDLDAGAMPGERLIDGIVDDLPQAVHQAALVGRPDVHARALAHGLQALENREVPRRVAVRRGVRGRRGRGAPSAPNGGGGTGSGHEKLPVTNGCWGGFLRAD